MSSLAWNYSLDRWQFQPKRVEVWIEKDAILGVVEQVCHDWQTPLYSCRGRPSLTMLYEAFENFPCKYEGKSTTILYFGDHDPTGRDIPEGISANIDMLNRMKKDNFSDDEVGDDFTKTVTIKWCAITWEQVLAHDIPTRPTKRKGPKAAAFEGDSVEIDALPPNLLRQIVEDAIEQEIDAELWQQAEDRERQEKGFLNRLERDLLEQEQNFRQE